MTKTDAISRMEDILRPKIRSLLFKTLLEKSRYVINNQLIFLKAKLDQDLLHFKMQVLQKKKKLIYHFLLQTIYQFRFCILLSILIIIMYLLNKKKRKDINLSNLNFYLKPNIN